MYDSYVDTNIFQIITTCIYDHYNFGDQEAHRTKNLTTYFGKQTYQQQTT